MLSKTSFVARLSPLEDVPPDEQGRRNEIITYNNYQTQELQDYTLTLSLIIILKTVETKAKFNAIFKWPLLLLVHSESTPYI